MRVSQVAALRRFWHPQIMPDFSSSQICIKPYANRPRSLNNALFLPTLKPEEPQLLIPHSQALISCTHHDRFS